MMSAAPKPRKIELVGDSQAHAATTLTASIRRTEKVIVLCYVVVALNHHCRNLIMVVLGRGGGRWSVLSLGEPSSGSDGRVRKRGSVVLFQERKG